MLLFFIGYSKYYNSSNKLKCVFRRKVRPNRTRTDDLLLVRQSLYQLSYGPKKV